jgi:hypothetical protein
MDENHVAKVAQARQRVETWSCTLLFDMSEAGDGSQIIDILRFVSTATSQPPSASDAEPPPPFPARYDTTKEGMALLRRDLRKAAQESGYQICVIKSTTKDGARKWMRFGCHRRRTYTAQGQNVLRAKNIIKNETGGPASLYAPNVKKTLLRVPKDKGTRGAEGLSMPRRYTTKRPKEASDTCSFYFNIITKGDADEARWVVGPGGNVEHCGHAKRTASEASRSAVLMEEEEIAVTNSMILAANAGSGTARDVLFARTGHVVQPAGLRYQKQERRKAEVASDFGQAIKGTPAESFLQDLLNDEGISYVALFDDFMESDLLKETGKGRPRTQRRIVSRSMTADGVTEESEFLPPEQHEIQAECCTMRQSLQMGDGRILIAVAWVTSEEKRLFHLFPEVLKADVTSQTNKERRPLFLLVGKDSYGSTFTALRCFMPSEQKWMFQWLWESATPLLMGKSVLRRNNLLLTDGDFNEYEPFVNARDTLYPHSQHGLCCYHLISLAISNKLGLCLSHLSARGKAFIRTFTDWVHSWTNDVETMQEYNLSKAALDCWFKSPAVVQESFKPGE